MSALAGLALIGGYFTALFLVGLVAIKVEERRKVRNAELAVDRLAAGSPSGGPPAGRTGTTVAHPGRNPDR